MVNRSSRGEMKLILTAKKDAILTRNADAEFFLIVRYTLGQ